MAFTEFYVRNGGSNMNAGSTNADAAVATFAGGDWNATTDVFTAASGADLSALSNGMYAALYHDGDTSPTSGQYQVGPISSLNIGARTFAMTSTGSVRLGGTEVATGTGNRTVKIGGAWAPASGASGFPFSFCTSTFATTATNPVRLNVKSDAVSNITSVITMAGTNFIVEGYEVSVGDRTGVRPKISGKGVAADSPFILLTTTGTGIVFRNMWFDGNFSTATVGTSGLGNQMLNITSTNCVVDNCLFTDSYRACIQVGGSGDKSGARITNCDFHNYNWADASDFSAIVAIEECSVLWCRFGTPDPDFVAGGDSAAIHIDAAVGENVIFMFNTVTNQTKAGVSIAAASCCIIAHNTIDNAAGYGIIYLGQSTGSMLIRDNIISRCPVGIRSHVGASGFSGLEIRNNVYYDVATKFSQVNASLTDETETAMTCALNPFVDGTNVGTTGNLNLDNVATGGAVARGAALGFYQATTEHFTDPDGTYAAVGAVEPDSGAAPVSGGGSNSTGANVRENHFFPWL